MKDRIPVSDHPDDIEATEEELGLQTRSDDEASYREVTS